MPTDLNAMMAPAPLQTDAWQSPNPSSSSSNRDPWELLGVVLEGKWLILGIIGTFVVAGLVYLWLTPPIYAADALLRVKQEQSFLKVLLDEPVAQPEERSANNEDVRILRSRAVLGRVVDLLNLTVDWQPVHLGSVGAAMARSHGNRDVLARPLLGMNDYAWGGERLVIETLHVPTAWLGTPLTLVALDEDRFSLLDADSEHLAGGVVGNGLYVPVDEEEGVLLLINELVARPGTRFQLIKHSRLAAVKALQRRVRVKSAEKQPSIVELSLKGPDPALLARIVNSIAATYQQLTVAWESSEADQRLRFLERQLPILRARLESSEAALNRFQREHSAVDLSLEAQTLLTQIVEFKTQLVNMRQNREELLERYTERHHDVLELDARINVVTGTIAELDARVKLLPDKQQALLRLSRDVRVDTELYISLLNSAQEQRIAKAGNIGHVRIVDDAVTPERPVFPSPPLVLGLAGTIGLFSGLAGVLLRRSLRRTVTDPASVERHIGLPVYASIPHSKRQSRLARLSTDGDVDHRVLARLHPSDESIESLRSLRATLINGMRASGSNVLMVCSPSAGMGKSFVCVNLAAVLAGPGNRVLLIDADLRKGRLNEFFGLPRAPGLTDVAQGKCPRGVSPILATPIERLHLLPSGRAVDNPGDILLARRLERIIATLREHFDYIVIDSTPVLAVADAAVVGRLSGSTIMVLKSGTHTLPEIAWSVKRLEQAGVRPDGLLFNDVKPQFGHPQYGGYPHSA